MQVSGINLRKQTVASLAMLEGDNGLTLKEVAVREGVTPGAISARRRRLERKLGTLLPRYESRGRKPASQAA